MAASCLISSEGSQEQSPYSTARRTAEYQDATEGEKVSVSARIGSAMEFLLLPAAHMWLVE